MVEHKKVLAHLEQAIAHMEHAADAAQECTGYTDHVMKVLGVLYQLQNIVRKEAREVS